MISDRLFRIISFSSAFVSYFGIVPMEWNSKSRCAIPSPRACQRARFNCFILYAWHLFGLFQLIRFYYFEKDLIKFYFVVFAETALSLSTESFTIITHFKDDSLLAFNTLIHYLLYMNSKKLNCCINFHISYNEIQNTSLICFSFFRKLSTSL